MQDQTKKEALFNEVKGSLFEYLVGRRLALLNGEELKFLSGLDKNYLNVLSQQDRMVRQFYPEMLSFLNSVSESAVKELIQYLGETPHSPQLIGKFAEVDEADLKLGSSKGPVSLSLKLNKKNAFVNTKSGGIKSFFGVYFPFIPASVQEEFNLLVDQEFNRKAHELHALNDMEFTGDYHQWVKRGKSELPGELTEEERKILKSFYARISIQMHRILSEAKLANAEAFRASLPALMGFSSPEILQLVCFHDFKNSSESHSQVHAIKEVENSLQDAMINPFNQTSSVELTLGDWALQIRVKPMNKFTTTAIKINCSVKFKRTSGA